MYEELIKELRFTERVTRDRLDGSVMLKAADAIEALQRACANYAEQAAEQYEAAADLQPVRHGRWEREKNWETGYEIWVNVCSACGAITPVNVSRYKYCPRCGAQMDKEARS